MATFGFEADVYRRRLVVDILYIAVPNNKANRKVVCIVSARLAWPYRLRAVVVRSWRIEASVAARIVDLSAQPPECGFVLPGFGENCSWHMRHWNRYTLHHVM